jgi:hypothetical protein
MKQETKAKSKSQSRKVPYCMKQVAVAKSRVGAWVKVEPRPKVEP